MSRPATTVRHMTDEAAQVRAHELFDPIAEGYLSRDGVDIGPMFGSEGLRIRGKVFAFVGYRGSLVVKVPEARADESSRRALQSVWRCAAGRCASGSSSRRTPPSIGRPSDRRGVRVRRRTHPLTQPPG